MNKNQKIKILDFQIDLSSIFNSYIKSMGFHIFDINLKNYFCSFLEELINDGAISLSDYSGDVGVPLTGTAKEQVQKLKDMWPTLETAKEIWPEDPWYYLEWLWWDITCTIGLSDLPNIDVYSSD